MNFNHFPQIAAAFVPFCTEVVTETAQDIIDEYAATAPRETGEMAESGYIKTSKESTYPSGSPSRKDAYYLPEVDTPDDDTTAIAAIAMNYAVYPEMGTVHQSPQPAFYPAVMHASDTLEDKLSGLEGYLKGTIT
jgi:hypothetical protein